MLSIEEINNTIEELENGNTTYDACIKLASLYIVRDKFRLTPTITTNATEKELGDILPQYQMYCEVKKKYQLNELTKESVLLAMSDVCREIKEFILTLYSSTEMQEERQALENMLEQLNNEM